MNKTALLFAGQGAQYPGMGKDLYDSNSAAREVFKMGERIKPGILDVCFEGSADELKKTDITQPCLFLVDLACARAVEACKIQVSAAAGFSLGEIAAAAFAGVFSDETAFKLVCYRGEVMAECADEYPGSMAAVLKLDRNAVEAAAREFDGVYPVNYNCPGQIVVSGTGEWLDSFSARVKELGGRTVKLAVGGPFHTPYMAKASDGLGNFLSDIKAFSPRIDLYSNLTGELYPDGETDIKDVIKKQASSSVLWEDIIRNMFDRGIDTFIEVGAGKTLSGFVSRTLSDVCILNAGDTISLSETADKIINSVK